MTKEPSSKFVVENSTALVLEILIPESCLPTNVGLESPLSLRLPSSASEAIFTTTSLGSAEID